MNMMAIRFLAAVAVAVIVASGCRAKRVAAEVTAHEEQRAVSVSTSTDELTSINIAANEYVEIADPQLEVHDTAGRRTASLRGTRLVIGKRTDTAISTDLTASTDSATTLAQTHRARNESHVETSPAGIGRYIIAAIAVILAFVGYRKIKNVQK